MISARRRLAARYRTALRAYLRNGHGAKNGGAQRLGRAALAEGLAIIDVAVIHEKATVALTSSPEFARHRNRGFKRAGLFFTQALRPLESARRAMHQTNRRLQREIERRQAGEEAIRQGHEQYRRLFLESQVMQRKLRRLTHKILSTQEEERKKISRELHDGVVQTLVGINVELSNLGNDAAVDDWGLKARIARTRRLVEKSVKAVHRFARELRPAVLDDIGLIPALHAYSQNLAERNELNIQLTACGGVEALGGAKRTVLFRVAQEALTNVARHARASQVRMSITRIRGVIRMEIGDNGRAFNVEKILLAQEPKRLGLIGMKERIEMVGGKFNIESTPGQGTTVRAEVPFEGEGSGA